MHKEKKNQLLNEWNEIANNLDDLLLNLDTDDTKETKKHKSEMEDEDIDSDRDSIHSDLSSEIHEDDIFSWTADGKTYRLLNDKERDLVKKKAEKRHKKFAEEFRQFKQERKEQLEKEMKHKDLPKFQLIRETRRGYAFLYTFLN